MRAWILPSPGPIETQPLRLAEVPTPEPGPGEALIRVSVCGICRTDLHVTEGELAPQPPLLATPPAGRLAAGPRLAAADARSAQGIFELPPPVRRAGITPGHQVVGTVVRLGAAPPGLTAELRSGQRVGVAWLHHTDGTCRFCRSGRENLCEQAEFTGWTVPGGFAEYVTGAQAFVYPVPEDVSDEQAAPLLCAGIIGYRCLRQCGIERWDGARLGIYGFGAAGHIAIQIARARGAEVYVCTRDHDKHQRLARELGAAWVGGAAEAPPERLDAAILFAPAGELVPPALRALERGGVLVLGGIHMSPIPELRYEWLYGERVIRSVANNTRRDGHEFLAEAARAGVKTQVQPFAFEQLNRALAALKHDGFAGAGVLRVSGGDSR